MCDPVSGDTPVQALHRAVDQLSEMERGGYASSDVIADLMEKLDRADRIAILARDVHAHYERQRQELIMKLQGES